VLGADASASCRRRVVSSAAFPPPAVLTMVEGSLEVGELSISKFRSSRTAHNRHEYPY
jgi:hypothetical protein